MSKDKTEVDENVKIDLLALYKFETTVFSFVS